MKKQPVLLTWRDVIVLIESVKRAEEIKPSQQAKRDVFKKFGILGSRKDPPLTAIFYRIMLRQGILDNIITQVTGVSSPLLLDAYLRAALRVFIELEVFSRRRVRYDNPYKVKRKVSALLSKRAHPYAGMWFWDTTFKLRNYNLQPRSEEEKLMYRYLLPQWFIRKITDLLTHKEAEELFKALNTRPLISVRVNTLKAEVKEVVSELAREGKKVFISDIVPTILKFEGPYNFDKSRLFLEGKIIIQEEAAALASLILGPRPGEVVVDLCAAPGGKTTHIAELMKNKGKIYAFDTNKRRIERMKELIERTGVSIVEIFMRDAREAPRILGKEVADRVLVDAPCTSDGTIMKNPELRWRIIESEVGKFAQLQYELLKAAVKLVKPGGYILYTTCSLLREENEDVIEKLLHKENRTELIPLNGAYDEGFLPGTMRAWPHKHNTIGFFYALLRKKT